MSTPIDTDKLRARAYLATVCPDCGSDHAFADAHYQDARASLDDVVPMADEIDRLRADLATARARALAEAWATFTAARDHGLAATKPPGADELRPFYGAGLAFRDHMERARLYGEAMRGLRAAEADVAAMLPIVEAVGEGAKVCDADEFEHYKIDGSVYEAARRILDARAKVTPTT